MVTQLNIVSDKTAKPLIYAESANRKKEDSLKADDCVEINGSIMANKVSTALQSSLDIEFILATFSQQIKPALAHDALTYHNDPLGVTIELGEKLACSCAYRLLINNEPLGEIHLHRGWEFSSKDRKVFEYTLCGIVYPLRNAILYKQAINAAHKDPLTGVNNRSTLEESLNREVKLAQRYDRKLSLIILDIDNFKIINDSYGHAAGDSVLKTIAELTQSCVRSTDILYRYGGEEFVVLLSNTDLTGAQLLAERIRQSIANATVSVEDTTVKISASLGVAELRSNEMNATFFTRADKALYQAKNSGKNRVCLARD